MYQALYRKYRPQTFDDLVGQMAVSQTLKTQLVSGKLSHAYLFTGSRGTGKTSTAKILAKAVNCLNPQDGNPCNCCSACQAIDAGSCMDVLEIDAASNNGVDNVRDLRDDAIYTPSQVKKRVYIIDEVHMLSISAFNALLKIIEEPPEHLLFILATTELHKVPATILSRCQRFSFRRISQEDIAARLQYVAYQERIDLDDSAARILARLADGGMRDGLSLLDQCASATGGELTAERVYSCLGIAGIQACGSLMRHIANKDTKQALALMNRIYAEGKDMAALMDELACLTRDFMVLRTAPQESISMLSGVASDEETKALSKAFSNGELVRMMNLIQQTAFDFSRSANKRMDAEVCIIRLCQPELEEDISSVIARLTRIEEQMKSGKIIAAPIVQESDLTSDHEELKQQDMKTDVIEEVFQEPIEDETPVGFWADLVSGVRKELPVTVSGFLSTAQDSSVKCELKGQQLYLVCDNGFIRDAINKPEVTDVFARKASAILGRLVSVKVTDSSSGNSENSPMEQLLQFGRNHSDFVKIKE